MNKRVFIERKRGFEIERDDLIHVLSHNLSINVTKLRYILFYDVFNVDGEYFDDILRDVLMENNRDVCYLDLPKSKNIIAYESIPGQFDQRADSAMQLIKLLHPDTDCYVTTGVAILIDDVLNNNDVKAIKKLLINKVESREKDFGVLEIPKFSTPQSIMQIDNFINMNSEELRSLYNEYQFAMSYEDLQFVQKYFNETEFRNPFETELKVLDTYWSDHCRHTTFETEITNVDFSNTELSKMIQQSFLSYLKDKVDLKRNHKPNTLMDLATINARKERSKNNLDDMEVSEEVNAASIFIDVDVEGVTEKWLLMFKNETHNHPTEIEPFGGASTCIGGAIRDPLSGRSYVYAALRVTGAVDITESVNDTIPGKLPQSLITKEAARGYSSYGNQIGLATTFVDEIYHQGYKAKRMEIGAVIGAAKADHVRRESPQPDDVVLLLGGKTGRDGIGGATGSSKVHTEESIHESSAEVQKGNAPEERKIQRLFRNDKVTKLIKKSNDFGAGGVSVAIGELADGLKINLDKVPTKYKGIDGTELAISESQERMSVVIDPKDVNEFMSYCHEENIEVVQVATVTKEKRLVMTWRGDVICDMARDFIDSSGVRQKISIEVDPHMSKSPIKKEVSKELKVQLTSMLEDMNIASQQGLVEMFDSTIGRTTVLAPYGGKYRLTKTQASVQKIPVQNKTTNTVSIMAYGYNPYLSEWSPYHGSTYAVLESMAKVVASGGEHEKIRFTFQEYFERLHKDPKKWSKPFSSLLGAYNTLSYFNLAAIGGKDSMSGTYKDISVPPTLVSFAITTTDVNNVISPEFKQTNNYLYLFDYDLDSLEYPVFDDIKANFEVIQNEVRDNNIVSAYALTYGGLAEALFKSSFGNKIGCEVSYGDGLFDLKYGAILVSSKEKISSSRATYIGKTVDSELVTINNISISINDAVEFNQERYNEVFPILHEDNRIIDPVNQSLEINQFDTEIQEEVRVVIPVFPGTNCEYDCEAAFVNEGAIVETVVFNNQSEKDIEDSLKKLANAIDNSHILMLSGGFSSGDEPDGSGKFIANVLKNKLVKESIERFLNKKNLILGICNGFQALVKAGLLPYGEIKPIEENNPTLFKNSINRHISKFVNTKISSQNSPWLSSFKANEVHTIAMSHGEGKFMIDEKGYQNLLVNNQVAFQYVDENNQPTYNPQYNPNGSSYAIEGIVSKDGLILGKMGHSERYTKDLFKNIHGNKDQNIFRNGVNYFKKGCNK